MQPQVTAFVAVPQRSAFLMRLDGRTEKLPNYQQQRHDYLRVRWVTQPVFLMQAQLTAMACAVPQRTAFFFMRLGGRTEKLPNYQQQRDTYLRTHWGYSTSYRTQRKLTAWVRCSPAYCILDEIGRSDKEPTNI